MNTLPLSVKKAMDILCDYESKRLYSRKLSGNIALKLALRQDEKSCVIEITDNAYKNSPVQIKFKPGKAEVIPE